MTVEFLMLWGSMRLTFAQILPVQRAALSLVLLLVSISSQAQTLGLPSTPALHERGPAAGLEKDLAAIFDDPKFSNAIWGVSVKSLTTGETLFRTNDTKSMLP